MFSLFSKWVFKVLGWRVEGWNFNDLDKYLIIVIPHTSNWDFFLGLLLRGYFGSYHLKYVGKDSLFVWPFGYIFKALGGYPVDRSKSNNFVDSIVDIYNNNERFVITLAPEGTRSKTDSLKTGFYYIAKGANIPIVMTTFDYGNKIIINREPYYLTDDMEKDFKEIEKFFKGRKGKNAADSFEFK